MRADTARLLAVVAEHVRARDGGCRNVEARMARRAEMREIGDLLYTAGGTAAQAAALDAVEIQFGITAIGAIDPASSGRTGRIPCCAVSSPRPPPAAPTPPTSPPAPGPPPPRRPQN